MNATKVACAEDEKHASKVDLDFQNTIWKYLIDDFLCVRCTEKFLQHESLETGCRAWIARDELCVRVLLFQLFSNQECQLQ